MKNLMLASLMSLLITSSRLFAWEDSASVPSAQTTANAQTPETLPAAPTPVAPLSPTPPPGPPPLVPVTSSTEPVLSWNAMDGFATRFWFAADYLLWFTKGDHLPPLVTTGSLLDRIPGALGQPGTQTLIGGEYNTMVRSGARFRGGYWFTPDQLIGIDGTFFFLGDDSSHFGVFSPGAPVLTQPFFNVNRNREDANIIAYPGYQNGGLAGSLSTQLWGADTNLRSMLFRGPSYQISLLGGFRFLDLHESLHTLESNMLYVRGTDNVAAWINSMDRFHVSNQFYGGQIGADFAWGKGRFSVDLLTKIALGASIQRSTIDGWTGYAAPNGSIGQAGYGQFALPSNIGWSEKDQFAVVPEFGLNLGYALTRHLRLTFGYTFLYWSRVFRPGQQIDRAINTTEYSAALGNGTVSGPQRPTFTFRDSDFWAQGLNFGLECRY